MKQCIKCKEVKYWFSFWGYTICAAVSSAFIRSNLCKRCAEDIAEKSILKFIENDLCLKNPNICSMNTTTDCRTTKI